MSRCSFLTAGCSINQTSAPGTNAQTVCINTPITNITYSTTSATGATFSGLPAGVTGAWAANVVTISGTPTAGGTFNYTVTLTCGSCTTENATGTITVNANNTVSLTSAPGTNNQSVTVNTRSPTSPMPLPAQQELLSAACPPVYREAGPLMWSRSAVRQPPRSVLRSIIW
ncbi:MAG: hypothetical protein IPI66_01050 [Chitinophagaceae bacterium]|nr:hypothetical protein [Chitinophagaceae bacterium]